jgi:hypothetical protein
MTLSVWWLTLLVQQVDRSYAILARRLIEFQRLSPLSGFETKGERWRGDVKKGRQVGIE